MPNDLSIKAAAAVTGASENPAEPQAASSTPPAHAPPAQAASPIPNPDLRLDAALGLVVIEFHDDSGTITTSIPSQRQLQAYRIWDQRETGPPGAAGVAGVERAAQIAPGPGGMPPLAPPAPTGARSGATGQPPPAPAPAPETTQKAGAVHVSATEPA